MKKLSLLVLITFIAGFVLVSCGGAEKKEDKGSGRFIASTLIDWDEYNNHLKMALKVFYVVIYKDVLFQ